MLPLRRKLRTDTERLVLRPPESADFEPWAGLRQHSAEFLQRWEPLWAEDHLTRKGFANRVIWSQRSVSNGTALPLFLFRRDGAGREGRELIGAITLDNIRRGPAMAGTLGYWIGAPYARMGYMREALQAVVHHAFTRMDLSRLEAACLPENAASRGLLEKCGFKYEGVAQAYLQIHGRWRNHVLYSNLRHDRRGRTDIG